MRINDAFPSTYLKASDLQGRSVRVVIDSVTEEKIGDDQKPVLRFHGKEKALVLNKTNALRIIEATSSDETDDWEGWTITLYPCKVDYQGRRVDAIRVDDRPGSARPPTQRHAARKPEPAPEVPDYPDFDGPPVSDDEIPF